MKVVNVALVVLLVVVVSGQTLGKSAGRISAKEKVGALRDLLLLQLSSDEEGVQISGPLFDIDLAYDGSTQMSLVDGMVAEFTSDAEGQWQGSVADGQLLRAAGSGDGDSVVEFGDNSTAAISTDGQGNADFVYYDVDGLTTTGEISSAGDVDIYGPSVNVKIDAGMDEVAGQAERISNEPDTKKYEISEPGKPTEQHAPIPVEISEEEQAAFASYRADVEFDAESYEAVDAAAPFTSQKPAPAPVKSYDDAQAVVAATQAMDHSIDADSFGSVQWLTDSLLAATRRPVVSEDPPQGLTPAKVKEALRAGEADSPDSYYTNAHQTSQNIDVFEVDSGDEPTVPTTPLNLTGVDVL